MYSRMSLSGSSDSRNSICAITRFATVSSIGVPTKMMLSFSNREKMSYARSPRLVLVRVFRLEEQHLRDHQVRHRVVDRCPDEDDVVLQQPRENVVRALAAAGPCPGLPTRGTASARSPGSPPCRRSVSRRR